MKIKFIIYLLYLVNLQNQNFFDYITERHMFNKFLIKNNKVQTFRKKITTDELFEGKYIGKIKTKFNKTYYLVYSCYCYNLASSPHSENHLFLYNNKKQYIGHYSLSSQNPYRFESNKVYFKISDCKDKIINFHLGIPYFINLGCNNEPDFYEFISN